VLNIVVGWFLRVPVLGRYLFLLQKSRRDLAASVALVADELDFIAESVSHYESGGTSMESVKDATTLDVWGSHRAALHAITRVDRELWDQLSSAMADLQRTKVRGALPPSSESLSSLAERLRSFRY